ncbi:hypothetical protein [Serratia symbiotica]|uniref:Uncharacterized protein n=1 Tax=Serratia symbiotica TaxID=138074 RepID=A0A068ZCQ7_9GAMM|nr:hypothetical protein [Serratia symbiotica]QLH63406.1 hypothetical protein SYMBAF_11315 [Serratia symbiotica]CDS58698.1 conserved hypothetical protein [Serratia symbiotica]
MLPEANMLSSELADVFCKLDLDDALQLANSSEDCYFGLCHGFHFLGKTFVSLTDSDQLEFSAETLCQLGHFLTASAILLPALLRLQKAAEFKIFNTKTDEA